VRYAVISIYEACPESKYTYITCWPIGKIFMLIMATLPSTLILYSLVVLV